MGARDVRLDYTGTTGGQAGAGTGGQGGDGVDALADDMTALFVKEAPEFFDTMPAAPPSDERENEFTRLEHLDLDNEHGNPLEEGELGDPLEENPFGALEVEYAQADEAEATGEAEAYTPGRAAATGMQQSKELLRLKKRYYTSKLRTDYTEYALFSSASFRGL